MPLPRGYHYLGWCLSQVATARVLAVGAGGIGCELLKTLVLTGFQDIEVVRSLFSSDQNVQSRLCSPKVL